MLHVKIDSACCCAQVPDTSHSESTYCAGCSCCTGAGCLAEGDKCSGCACSVCSPQQGDVTITLGCANCVCCQKPGQSGK